VFTEFYFAIYNGFSGQIYFPDFYSLLYNAVYTSWPCILCYSFERDVGEELALNYPILYRAGQIEYYFNLKKFWTWIILAFFHGLINFFISQYVSTI
jgi:magnesium-transporting ATPase (P-type)